jgi:peptide/nickel transport system permease protein
MTSRSVASWLLGALVLIAFAVLAAPGTSYSNQDRDLPLAASSAHHPAGTDALGRDRMVRVSAAFLLSLAGATVAAAATTLAAAAVGALSAFSPALLGGLVMLVCDLFLALPWLFLLMMVRSALPLTTSPAHSAVVTFLVLAALGWCKLAREACTANKSLITSCQTSIHCCFRNSLSAFRHL